MTDLKHNVVIIERETGAIINRARYGNPVDATNGYRHWLTVFLSDIEAGTHHIELTGRRAS